MPPVRMFIHISWQFSNPMNTINKDVTCNGMIQRIQQFTNSLFKKSFLLKKELFEIKVSWTWWEICKASFFTYARTGVIMHEKCVTLSFVNEVATIFKCRLSKKTVPTLINHYVVKWVEIRKSYCQEFTIQKS